MPIFPPKPRPFPKISGVQMTRAELEALPERPARSLYDRTVSRWRERDQTGASPYGFLLCTEVPGSSFPRRDLITLIPEPSNLPWWQKCKWW